MASMSVRLGIWKSGGCAQKPGGQDWLGAARQQQEAMAEAAL
jgi:hypothetical protein